MEVRHHDASPPTAALSTAADSLPDLGIVAAVLGVVITMERWAGLRKKSDTRLPLRWWEHSWDDDDAKPESRSDEKPHSNSEEKQDAKPDSKPDAKPAPGDGKPSPAQEKMPAKT